MMRGTTRVRWRDERGAGSGLVVGIIAVMFAVCGVLLGVMQLGAHSQRLAGAADAGALAAADIASGRNPGEPCSAAQLVAAAHDAQLVVCEIRGAEVYVEMTSNFAGMWLCERALAGPPRT